MVLAHLIRLDQFLHGLFVLLMVHFLYLALRVAE